MSSGQLRGVMQYLRRAVSPDTARLSDGELLARFTRHRDQTAFELLVWRHERMVLGVCRRVLQDTHGAEDAFQATFLTLVRKAESISKRESVGGWLHKVAYRIALTAKAKATRRSKCEQTAGKQRIHKEDHDPLVWDELQPVLDKELNSLPDRSRVPFVLCYLEGKSYEEIARELGWAKGTVASVLARAREKLRARLTHRGIMFSAAALSATLTQTAWSAAVPSVLVSRTLESAAIALGGQVSGATSAQVVALVKGAVKGMLLAKLQTSAAIALVLSVLCAGGGMTAYATLGHKDPTKATNQETKSAGPEAGERGKVESRRLDVRVVDGNGQPVAAARVGVIVGGKKTKAEATGADGKAVLFVPKDGQLTSLYAFKSHQGLDYRAFIHPRSGPDQAVKNPEFPTEGVTLTLDGARPLRIRAVDRHDKPIVGLALFPWLLSKPGQVDDLNLSSAVDEFTATTNGDGVVVFDWLPRWHEKLLQIWPSTESYVRHRGIYDPKSGSDTLVMKLDRLVPISGRVTFEEGKPGSNIKIAASGEGYQFDGFHGEATTDKHGKYHLKVAPNMVYLLVVLDDKWAAAPKTGFVVWPDKPIDDLDFALRAATRIHGQVTLGRAKTPVKGQQINVRQTGRDAHNLKDINLPNPEGSNKWVQPSITRWATTDGNGRFELFVGPGTYEIFGPVQSKVEKLEITNERDREVSFHAPRAERGILTGLVVTGEPARPVPAAQLIGIYRHALAGIDMEATADQNGRFSVERALHRTVIRAQSADRKLAGIVEIGPDDESTTIRIQPLATASGRLVDAVTGNPLTGHEIKFGIRVPIGGDDAPWRTSFGGRVTTDKDGRFALTSLVVGQKYEVCVTLEADRRWGRMTEVEPAKAEHINLGDIEFAPERRPPTLAERVTSAFRQKLSARERYERARSDCRLSHQHVLIIFGDPEDEITQQLFKLRYEDDQVRGSLDPYRLVEVCATGPTAPEAVALAKQVGEYQNRQPLPLLCVVNVDGKRVATAEASSLLTGKTIDRQKLIAFANIHAPKPLDARQLLNDALARAKAENKRVIVQETATWCGPCWRLSRFLDRHRDKWEKDYIWIKIDHRWSGWEQVMKPLRPDASGGIPWYGILDAEGKTLATSNNHKGQNIGFPSNKEGRDHFASMIRKTAIRLTEGEIDALVRALSGRDG